MKSPEECEAIGLKMSSEDFYRLESPEGYINNLKAGYLRLKYANMLIGFVKKESESIETKIDVFRHVNEICGYSDITEEHIIEQIRSVNSD